MVGHTTRKEIFYLEGDQEGTGILENANKVFLHKFPVNYGQHEALHTKLFAAMPQATRRSDVKALT